MLKQHLKKSFLDANETLKNFISQDDHFEKMEALSEKIADAFKSDHKVIIFGNGGSSCDATHFAQEFTGRYRKNRRPLPVIVINDGSHLTCTANDYGFDQVFLRGVEAFAQAGDVVIGISTSGKSQNVILAMECAKKKENVTTVALLGRDGGEMKGKYHYEWIVPGITADRIQEIHMLILHVIIEGVERIIFPELYE